MIQLTQDIRIDNPTIVANALRQQKKDRIFLCLEPGLSLLALTAAIYFWSLGPTLIHAVASMILILTTIGGSYASLRLQNPLLRSNNWTPEGVLEANLASKNPEQGLTSIA